VASRWFHWLSWPIVEVREGDDEALLFTIDRYRGLQTTWIVRDADERLVGKLRGRSIWDPADRVVAQADGEDWQTPAGQRVATLEPSPDGLLLTFHGDINPFLRMLLVAAAVKAPCKPSQS
jgi:hypothetical protein